MYAEIHYFLVGSDEIQFYKPLASSLNPAETFSPRKNSIPGDVQHVSNHFIVLFYHVLRLQALGEQAAPRMFFSCMEGASLEISSMGIIEIPTFFQGGGRV